ncbi:hypothetical protein ES332_A10G237900v1 [Gossypium tomentosum]|uniref:Uncharacterized protein n=1 Tax=Gossypium tomentosum TaxID=34277 RepID=A0A5D2NWZ0_GOSTO|nr:hypothetical protein ES332_A10G237900v1 [Gossypium tomentosum]
MFFLGGSFLSLFLFTLSLGSLVLLFVPLLTYHPFLYNYPSSRFYQPIFEWSTNHTAVHRTRMVHTTLCCYIIEVTRSGVCHRSWPQGHVTTVWEFFFERTLVHSSVTRSCTFSYTDMSFSHTVVSFLLFKCVNFCYICTVSCTIYSDGSVTQSRLCVSLTRLCRTVTQSCGLVFEILPL